MKLKTIKTYKLSELPEQTQEKIFLNFSAEIEYPFQEENRQVISYLGDIFDLNNLNWSYDEQTYNISFTTNIDYEYEIDNMNLSRFYRFIHNNLFPYLYEPRKSWIYIDKNNTKHHNTVGINGRQIIRKSSIHLQPTCPTGYYLGEASLNPIREWLLDPYPITYHDLINLALSECLLLCQTDLEDYYSEENIREIIEANEYYFTEDGEIA